MTDGESLVDHARFFIDEALLLFETRDAICRKCREIAETISEWPKHILVRFIVKLFQL